MMTIKKIGFWFYIVTMVCVIYLLTTHFDWLIVPPFASAASAEKIDTSTQNCPANTSEGAYFLRGTDSNGKVLCGFSFYNACPYSEAVSADDPMCQKAAPALTTSGNSTPAPVSAPITTVPIQHPVSTCGGK